VPFLSWQKPVVSKATISNEKTKIHFINLKKVMIFLFPNLETTVGGKKKP